MTIARALRNSMLRHFAGFAATGALVFQLLLPVHGFGVFTAGHEARVPVCTGTGIVWKKLGGDDSRAEKSGPENPLTPPGGSAHCPFCLAHASPAALAALVVLPVPARPLVLTRLRPASVAPSVPPLRHAPPRGPPAIA